MNFVESKRKSEPENLKCCTLRRTLETNQTTYRATALVGLSSYQRRMSDCQ